MQIFIHIINNSIKIDKFIIINNFFQYIGNIYNSYSAYTFMNN